MSKKTNDLKKRILSARKSGDFEREKRLMAELERIQRPPADVQQAYVDSYL